MGNIIRHRLLALALVSSASRMHLRHSDNDKLWADRVSLSQSACHWLKSGAQADDGMALPVAGSVGTGPQVPKR